MRGDLFRPLNLGQVLGRAIFMFVDRFYVYMALSTAVLAPLLLVRLLIATVVGMQVFEGASENSVVEEKGQDVPLETDMQANFSLYASTHLKLLAFWGLVYHLLGMLIYVPGEAGMVRAAAETYAAEDGQPTNYSGWWTCLMQFGVPRLGHLWLGRLYMELPIVVGLAVCVTWLVVGLKLQSGFLLTTSILVSGMYVGLVFWWGPSVLLTIPVMVVERKGPMDAIRRSFEITQGRRCYVMGVLVIFGFVGSICARLFRGIFIGGDSALDAMFKPTGVVIGGLPDLLYFPLHTILTFCLYASVRADTEGLTRSVLQRELRNQPTSSMAPYTDYGQVPVVEKDDNVIAQGLISDSA